MIKRILDILLSFLGLFVLLPFFIFISIFILFDSKGGIFYKQIRVGRNGIFFYLFKFRTMLVGSEKRGLITVGAKDSRVTTVGYYLRKYKLDELPQLFNVFIGDMSLVGPRPEVRKYVKLYNEEQKKVLSVKPGITDYASIEYANENELLGKADNPEEVYVKEIMPAKLLLNLKYIEQQNFFTDLKIIFSTIFRIIFNR